MSIYHIAAILATVALVLGVVAGAVHIVVGAVEHAQSVTTR